MQKTLILLKPDCVKRRLMGQVLARFERKGLRVVGMKLMKISEELAAQHYSAHTERPFYAGLVKFMTSSPVVAMALEGIDAVAVCRNLMGATFGADAAAGTIRGDLGISRSFNLVHGSDSAATAATELALFFPDGFEEYDLDAYRWISDAEEELPKSPNGPHS